MKILNSYDGITKEDIEAMSKEQLQSAILRVFSMDCHRFHEQDSWSGWFICPDEIAEAFRDRAQKD